MAFHQVSVGAGIVQMEILYKLIATLGKHKPLGRALQQVCATVADSTAVLLFFLKFFIYLI